MPGLGVELTLSSGALVQVGWGWQFACYGLALCTGDESPLWHSSVAMQDVSDDIGWASVLGETISTVLVYWHVAPADDDPCSEYPQDLELLTLSGTQVWLSAARLDDATGRLNGAADEIVVTFDLDLVRKKGLGSFALADCLRRITGA